MRTRSSMTPNLLLGVLMFLGCHRLTPHEEQSAEPPQAPEVDLQRDLVGYWKLQGDSRDHSGHGHDAVNQGADLATGSFDGRKAYVEVPASDSLKPPTGTRALPFLMQTARSIRSVRARR